MLYAVYDLKDNEQCIGIFESTKELAKYFNSPESSIKSAIYRSSKYNWRYLIVRIK